MENKTEKSKDFIEKIFDWNQLSWFEVNNVNKHLENSLLIEEVAEFLIALKDQNKIEIADAFWDIIFVLCWTMYKLWFTSEQCKNIIIEVIESNFSKFEKTKDGSYKVLRDKGWKIQKGKNFRLPNFEFVLTEKELKEYKEDKIKRLKEEISKLENELDSTEESSKLDNELNLKEEAKKSLIKIIEREQEEDNEDIEDDITPFEDLVALEADLEDMTPEFSFMDSFKLGKKYRKKWKLNKKWRKKLKKEIKQSNKKFLKEVNNYNNNLNAKEKFFNDLKNMLMERRENQEEIDIDEFLWENEGWIELEENLEKRKKSKKIKKKK